MAGLSDAMGPPAAATVEHVFSSHGAAVEV